MADAANVAELATVEKLVRIGNSHSAEPDAVMELRLRFKDAYILRAGHCDFTGRWGTVATQLIDRISKEKC